MIQIAESQGVSVVALMEVKPDQVSQYGIAITEGKQENNLINIAGFIEKPDMENAPSNLAIIGRYVLQPQIFKILENTKPGLSGEIQLTDALNTLAQQHSGEGAVLGLIHTGRRFDTGNKISYMKACVELAMEHKEIGAEFSEWIETLSSELPN